MGQQPPGQPQAPWRQQGVPPQKGNSLKWLLVAIAVLLVIGVTIGATLLFTRGDGNAPSTPGTSGAPTDIASANDTGPVSVITDEPTCQTYMNVNNGLADIEAKGWGAQRSTLGPVSEWSPDQRSQVQAVSTAMRNAADQVTPLAKQTPHRLVREMYEQFIVYGRAYADSVPNYTPADNFLASANVNIGSALFAMCNSITYGSANRALGVEPAPPPSNPASPADTADVKPFAASSDSSCANWVDRERQFTEDTSEWSKTDAAIPASQWTPEQRTSQHAALPILSAYADDMAAAGMTSGNPVLEDFAVAAAIYIRSYVSSGDNYVKADGWLSSMAFRLSNTISAACQAPGT